MKRKYFLLFLFLLVIPFSLAITFDVVEEIYNETYEFAGTYASDDYSKLGALPDSPRDFNSELGENFSQAYGHSGMSTSFSQLAKFSPIAFNGTMNDTTKVYIVKHDFMVNHSSGGSDSNPEWFDFSLFAGGSGNFLEWHMSSVNNSIIMINEMTGGSNCHTPSIPADETLHQLVLHIDYPNGVYNLYIDGDNTGCSNRIIGDSTDRTPIPVDGYVIRYNRPTGQNAYIMIDNIFIYEGEIILSSAESCELPVIFCDTFNYDGAIATGGWTAYTGGFSVDTTFSPTENKLALTGTGYLAPFHETGEFAVDYPTESGLTTIGSIYSPVVSVQFDVNVSSTTDNDESFSYTVNAHDGKRILTVKTRTEDTGLLSWLYRDDIADTLSYKFLCVNCSTENVTTQAKFIIKFDDNFFYDFNSSNTEDSFDFYLDGVEKNITIPFLDTTAISVGQYQFLKNYDPQYTIDNYYVMLGTDTEVDTSPQYYEELFVPDTINETLGEGTGDLATNVESIWSEMGLNSLASRVIVGLILILFVFGITASLMATYTQSGSAVVITSLIVSFIFMILLTIVKLLPWWIPLLIGIMGGGIGAFFIAKSISGG